MQLRSWRLTLLGALALVPAVLLFALYTWWQRHESGDLENVSGLESLVQHTLVFALIVGFVIVFLLEAWRRYHLRTIAKLTNQIVQLRKNPVRHATAAHAPELADYPDLMPALAELEVLAKCYRRALVAIVDAKAESDARAASSTHYFPANQELPAQSGPPRDILGSSRHRMVARLTPTFHWTAATPPLLRLLGCTSRDVIARAFTEVIHLGDTLAVVRSLREALRDGEAHNITFRVLVSRRPALEPEPPERPKPGSLRSRNAICRWT